MTPPILVSALRRVLVALGLRRPLPAPECEYVPEGWSRPVPGWNAEGVLETYRQKWPAFAAALRGPGPLPINHESAVEHIQAGADLGAHNLLVTFAYVLELAARGRDRLALLDWGGGIGHYYAIAQAVLPGVEIEYHARDLPLLVAEGRRLFPEATFHDDDRCLDRHYDLVLASSSLNYSEDWRDTFAGLARAPGATSTSPAFRSPSAAPLSSCSSGRSPTATARSTWAGC